MTGIVNHTEASLYAVRLCAFLLRRNGRSRFDGRLCRPSLLQGQRLKTDSHPLNPRRNGCARAHRMCPATSRRGYKRSSYFCGDSKYTATNHFVTVLPPLSLSLSRSLFLSIDLFSIRTYVARRDFVASPGY